MNEFIVVLVSAGNEDEAAGIATALVEKKLAACCNILKEVRSIFRWDGALQDETEVLLVIKTRRDAFDALEKEVKRLHSYSTPEIIALPVVAGNKSYLQWVGQSTS